MVGRKPVPSLEDLSVSAFRRFLTAHCWRVAAIYRGVDMDDIVRREELLPIHIAELRQSIFQTIPWYLDQKMTKEIISGVHDAVEMKQSMYNLNTPIALYKTELYCMVTMADLMVTKRLRRLDMPTIPKILRTHVTARLQDFTGLEYCDMLLLGFGVDCRQQDCTEFVAPSNIISAIRCMSCLSHLILPNFCTNNIIRALANTCRQSLRCLEIDHSIRMTDSAVSDFLKLDNLKLLSMANSPLGMEALATIVFGLPKLLSLPNGDFLCEILEWMVYESENNFRQEGAPLPQLAIKEFCSSEDYHFHSKKQMELVTKMCPNIAQVKFFYDSELICEISVLENFHNLRELKLNGGDFSKDPLRPLIEKIGHQLTKLEFNHVENIDRHAIVQMSLCCIKLEFLSFSACAFLDYGALHRELFDYYNAGGLETVEEIELVLLLRDQEAFNQEIEGLIKPFNQLTNLSISCSCSSSTMMFLLLHCPALTKLFIGSNNGLNDETLLKVLSVNPLTNVEEIELRPTGGNDLLTRTTLDILVNNLPNLRRLKGLTYWTTITDQERAQFQDWVKRNNLDLDITDMVPVDYAIFRSKFEISDGNKEEYRRYFSTA